MSMEDLQRRIEELEKRAIRTDDELARLHNENIDLKKQLKTARTGIRP